MITLTLILQLALPLIVGALAYYVGALDGLSSIVGIIIGYLVIFSRGTEGLNWFLIFLTFFVASIMATKYKYKEKEAYDLSQQKRRIGNVLGNGLAPVSFAIIGNPGGFIAALATATADTLSSEIGVLSPIEPVSILDFKTKVKRGSNGGVSNLGNTFMFFGAGLIGFLGLVLFQSWPLFWIGLWGGVFGCVVDSILGATLENKGIMGNSMVNFFSTSLGGIFGYLLFAMANLCL